MALVTICPGCGTTFRVSAAQLQAHSGDVRCGHCQRIFNGFATLITVNESAIACPFQTQPQTVSEPEVAAQSQACAENINNAVDQSVITDRRQETTETSDQLFGAQAPVKQSQGAWGVANVFLLLLLIGQIAYTYRTELTIVAPQIRSHLERYCALIACTVPYPQDIRQLGIEASDLEKNPVRQPEVATLSAVIRNHAPFPQALPALQLSLLDAEDQLIASRIFTAQDYLQEEDKALQFIASQHEIEIRLDFFSSDLGAASYRLLLLYL
ncbi:zinc-ribbon and DUF3426 domain-containing protein [Nitrosomonas sp. Nm166]|uniref:zinc-ribbon and DUF3426 domain-containing protein n=1 Tax=Nitrosomonas sp. Nm166 TaxID=1881054 RepID=UPI0008EC63DF|nr:zinc-ribbon and DUF3426 domain-containing protein [Nitrosomonas sp. Nm166]SFE80636.1 MJ0042 family finger-like domain-containing protein [Nitrosomonas sp. Nm166]